MVWAVSELRPRLRRSVGPPRRHRVRQDRHRGPARAGRHGPDLVDPHDHGLPRGHPDLLPARSAARRLARGAHRKGPGARHGAGPRRPGRRGAVRVGISPVMDRTAELRWFRREPFPGPVVTWFADAAAPPVTRSDTYLVLPGTDALGVKVRGGSTSL